MYIGADPKSRHVAQLQELPVHLLLSMRLWRPHASVRRGVDQWIHLPCVDSPLTPIPMTLLWRGVQAALPVVEQGRIVMVHCHYGRHRSVALASCILIGQGYTPEAAMELIKHQRPVADPYAWYIRLRIEKFAREWT